MSARIYAEGGGSKSVDIELRKGFKRFWERCGFQGRLPRMFPSGGRGEAYRDFENHVTEGDTQGFVGLLIDSEDPITDIERTWDHLRQRDGWDKPTNAADEQVLFMTTCMETWIAADREALSAAYARRGINVNALPPLDSLEIRSRNDVFNRLGNATGNQFDKGEESFRALGRLNPETIEPLLPSFARARRILNEKL